MRAKKVNRPDNDYKNNVKNFREYILKRLKDEFPNKSMKDLMDSFWEYFYNAFDTKYEDLYNIGDEFLDVLKHTPIEYQIKWMKPNVDDFIDMYKEEYEDDEE